MQSKREQENVKIANDALNEKTSVRRQKIHSINTTVKREMNCRQLNSVAATLEAKRLRDLQVEEKKALTTHEKGTIC